MSILWCAVYFADIAASIDHRLYHLLFCQAFSSYRVYISTVKSRRIGVVVLPLPSNRHHLSCDDCLEDKRENYQNCSVLCCVLQL